MQFYATIASEHGVKSVEGDEFLEISVKGDNDQQDLMLIRIVPVHGTNQYDVRMMARLRDSDYDFLGSSLDDRDQPVYKVQEFKLHGTN